MKITLWLRPWSWKAKQRQESQKGDGRSEQGDRLVPASGSHTPGPLGTAHEPTGTSTPSAAQPTPLQLASGDRLKRQLLIWLSRQREEGRMQPPFTAWFIFRSGMHHDLKPPALPLWESVSPTRRRLSEAGPLLSCSRLYSQCPDSVRKTSYSGGAIYPGGAGFFTQVPRQWPGSP